jgi:hypothetical protein
VKENGDTVDTILVLIKQLEATLLGLQQLRGYVEKGAGSTVLESLIEEGETKLEEVKRSLMQ